MGKIYVTHGHMGAFMLPVNKMNMLIYERILILIELYRNKELKSPVIKELFYIRWNSVKFHY